MPTRRKSRESRSKYTKRLDKGQKLTHQSEEKQPKRTASLLLEGGIDGVIG